MESNVFEVPNISCGHCVRTIQNELGELTGVKLVQADVETKKVVVEWQSPASVDKIKDTLAEIGYPALN